MPYHVNRLSGQPIIVITASDPFNPAQDMPVIEQQFAKLAAEIPGRIYRVIDNSRWTSMKFSDVVEVLARDSREGVKLASDSRVITVVVGTSEMTKLTTSASSQQQYRYANMPKLFGSLDEAIAYVQAELATSAHQEK